MPERLQPTPTHTHECGCTTRLDGNSVEMTLCSEHAVMSFEPMQVSIGASTSYFEIGKLTVGKVEPPFRVRWERTPNHIDIGRPPPPQRAELPEVPE